MDKKLTVLDMLEIREAIAEIQREVPLAPAVFSMKLGVTSRKLRPILEEYNESRNAIIKELGETHEETGQPFIPPNSPKNTEFAERDRELQAAEYPITGLPLISYEETQPGPAGKEPEMLYPPSAMMVLGLIISFDGAEPTDEPAKEAEPTDE